MLTNTDRMYIKAFSYSMGIFVLLVPLMFLHPGFFLVNAFAAPLIYLIFVGPSADEINQNFAIVADPKNPTAKDGAGFDTFKFDYEGARFDVSRSDIIAEKHEKSIVSLEHDGVGEGDIIETILVDRLTNMPFLVITVREACGNAQLNRPHAHYWIGNSRELAVGTITRAYPIFTKSDMMQKVAEIDPSKIATIDFDAYTYFRDIAVSEETVKFSHEAYSYA